MLQRARTVQRLHLLQRWRRQVLGLQKQLLPVRRALHPQSGQRGQLLFGSQVPEPLVQRQPVSPDAPIPVTSKHGVNDHHRSFGVRSYRDCERAPNLDYPGTVIVVSRCWWGGGGSGAVR